MHLRYTNHFELLLEYLNMFWFVDTKKKQSFSDSFFFSTRMLKFENYMMLNYHHVQI